MTLPIPTAQSRAEDQKTQSRRVSSTVLPPPVADRPQPVTDLCEDALDKRKHLGWKCERVLERKDLHAHMRAGAMEADGPVSSVGQVEAVF